MIKSQTKKRRALQWAACFTTILVSVSLAAATEETTRTQLWASVNDVPISEAAVREHVRAYLRRIGHTKLSESRMATLEKEMLKKLIEEELLYQEGRRQGLVVSEEDIEVGLARIRDRFSSDTDFEAALAKARLDPAAIRKGVERSLLIEKTWEKLVSTPENERRQALQKLTTRATIVISTQDSGDDFVN